MNYQFNHSILGGTFDRLHAGHKHFLDTAFASSEYVTIGLTTPALFSHKLLSENIESYDIRLDDLITYLTEKGYDKRSTIIKLSDIYGNSLNEQKIDSIFINEHGVKNAHIINEKRQKRGLAPLTIEVVPLIKGDDRNVISSSRIRIGEINRNGNSYLKFLTRSETLKLPEEHRNELKIPLGKVLTKVEEAENKGFIITVGDIVTSNFIKMETIPDISVFDGKSERQTITDKQILDFLPKEYQEFENKPGNINAIVVKKIFGAIQSLVNDKKQTAIKIIGEEDLLTLPLILLSPLCSTVFYGQPNIGAVAVFVTEQKKEEVKLILSSFQG